MFNPYTTTLKDEQETLVLIEIFGKLLATVVEGDQKAPLQ